MAPSTIFDQSCLITLAVAPPIKLDTIITHSVGQKNHIAQNTIKVNTCTRTPSHHGGAFLSIAIFTGDLRASPVQAISTPHQTAVVPAEESYPHLDVNPADLVVVKLDVTLNLTQTRFFF
jgi:hypothetical protein